MVDACRAATAAIATERERCAKIADGIAKQYREYADRYDDEDGYRAKCQAHSAEAVAEAIRSTESNES